MKRLLQAVVCAMCLAGTAVGQTGPNFGSRTSGLGNAGGFATGSGFSNGATGSLNFGQSTAAAFGYGGGLPSGGNALYNYGGGAFNGGNAYLGSNNLGVLNAGGLSVPGLNVPGLGLGANGLGVGGWDGAMSNAMGWGGAGWYGGGLGVGGGLPGLGLDATGLGLGIPGLGYGVPATGYGMPMTSYGMPMAGYGVPGLNVAGATSAGALTRNRRTESFTNNAPQDRANALAAGVPTVTANALRIQERIARSGSRANFRNVKVLMSGRTVVLQGSVDSQADEQLVQRLVSLEPGVDGVISQLDYPGKAHPTTVSAR